MVDLDTGEIHDDAPIGSQPRTRTEKGPRANAGAFPSPIGTAFWTSLPGVGPGVALPEHDVAHRLDEGQAASALLAQRHEVRVGREDLGHRGSEAVRAGTGGDVGRGDADLALDRAAHGPVDVAEVAELGGCWSLAGLGVALDGRGGAHEHHQGGQDRHADEDDQDGQPGEQQLLHDRSVPRALMFRLEIVRNPANSHRAASMASLV